jgi:peptidyl-Asp metalloendopeptidase
MDLKSLARCCTGAFVVLALPATAADNALFQPAPLTPLVNDAAFVEISKARSTHAASAVLANAAAIEPETGAILLDLDIDGPVRLTATRKAAYRNDDGSVVWEGTVSDTTDETSRRGEAEIASDPMNSVTLVRDGTFVTGSIRVHGQLFAVRPLFDGRHVVIEVDESKMPPDHDPAAYRQLFDAARRSSLAPSDGPDASQVQADAVVRVIVSYTGAAERATPSIGGLINLAVSETNQGYAHSGVNVTLRLADKHRVSYAETGNFHTELARYRAVGDGHMDGVHGLRNDSNADLAVLIVNGDQYCGLGYLKSTASSAFSVVSRSCATGYYSFAHEMGHNFGADHDPDNADNSPYAYGHGFRRPGAGWRTIMAYDCDDGCTRINYWSNPNRNYRGQSMGTAAKHNNARVLNQRAATVAAFR